MHGWIAGAFGRRFRFGTRQSVQLIVSVTFLAYSLSQWGVLSMSRRSRRQARMSSRFHLIARAAALSAMLAFCS
ncbi:MAG: hypothetical protein ABI407_10005, partial [Bradyrhizobium sp.]